ncbi:hypothetical protein Osc7112_0016 [Oscillatoria nigro-viridis PCC 7112]|uniref:Uncharacterized protein n=1 Tax=Phormidium nigroviride PCC 7112 TaxID=179408 RepID=K9V9B8_9CYAN|nr:hypothetical protein Osc7112_0016 [Oscillatoria nigro-viridis PCC 7112]
MNSIANIKQQGGQCIGVNLTESPPGNEFHGAFSLSPMKRTNEFFSPLQRTFAMRPGIHSLPD